MGFGGWSCFCDVTGAKFQLIAAQLNELKTKKMSQLAILSVFFQDLSS